MDNREIGKELMEALQKRMDFGIEKYGPKFVGDPLQHLEEELMDALFYIYAIKKQRRMLQNVLPAPGCKSGDHAYILTGGERQCLHCGHILEKPPITKDEILALASCAFSLKDLYFWRAELIADPLTMNPLHARLIAEYMGWTDEIDRNHLVLEGSAS